LGPKWKRFIGEAVLFKIPMKSLNPQKLAAVVAFGLLQSACTNKDTLAETTRAEIEAKTRAEAARTEMEKLPTTFKSRYNRKLEPETVKLPSDGATGSISQPK